MNKKQYVLGFCFMPDGRCFFIEKSKPDDWQRGLVNGIGGKAGAGESFMEAMIREFWEETGVQTHAKNWLHELTLSGKDWDIAVFRGSLQVNVDVDQVIDEGCVFVAGWIPWNAEQTAAWLYWLCRDLSRRDYQIREA